MIKIFDMCGDERGERKRQEIRKKERGGGRKERGRERERGRNSLMNSYVSIDYSKAHTYLSYRQFNNSR